MSLQGAELEKANQYFQEIAIQSKGLIDSNEELKAENQNLREELDQAKKELELLEDFRDMGPLPKAWTVDITDKDVMNAVRKTAVRLYGQLGDPFRDKSSEESKTKAVKQVDRLIKGALLYVFLNDMHVNSMLKRANLGLQIKSALDKVEEGNGA